MEQAKALKAFNWSYTLNNPTHEEIESISGAECVFHIYGQEHPDTTPHLQGYIQFKHQKRMNEVKKALGTTRLHLEKSNGTADQNIAYCSKEDIDPFIKGTPKQPRKRTDIDLIKDLVKTNTVKELIEDGTLRNQQQVKFAHTCFTYQQEHRTTYPRVVWLCGDSGAGKSKYIYDRHQPDEVHKQSNSIKFWDGYENQPIVVLDDIRADFAKFHELLTLLDKYPHRVEVKGDTRIFNSSIVYVTSPYTPAELYKNKSTENLIQLIRRVDEIHEYRHPDILVSTPKEDWYSIHKDREYTIKKVPSNFITHTHEHLVDDISDEEPEGVIL
uniref:hypothetical protein n=4 Tax=Pseudomonadati TaxID=3379134 RepID=UPI00404812A9